MSPLRAHHRLLRCVVPLLLVMLLVVGLWPVYAYASANVYDTGVETIRLNGSFDGQFTLDSDSSELFHLEGAVPGDSWIGRIKIKNKAPAKMDIALLSIVNELMDETLFNALTLDIKSGKEFIYSGSYGATETPITGYYTLKPGETMIIDVRVSLPASAGNEIQNRKMDSKWIFEARYYGQTSPQTGDDLFFDTVRDGTVLLIVLLAAAAVAIVGIRLHLAKKALVDQKEEKGNSHEEKH